MCADATAEVWLLRECVKLRDSHFFYCRERRMTDAEKIKHDR